MRFVQHKREGVCVVKLLDPPVFSEEEMLKQAGSFVKEGAYDVLVGVPGSELEGPVEIYTHEDQLLAKYIPNVLSEERVKEAWPVLRAIGGEASNRGTASGVKATRKKLKDGSYSKTLRVDTKQSRLRGVGSAIIGAFERASPRFPTCRLTAFNLEHPERFQKVLPFIQEVDAVFARWCPERYNNQHREIERTHPAWTIHGTSFTTVTVNKNFRTALHVDRGDLHSGFGVLTALRAGHFEGCHFVLPAYRVAVDMHTRGVMLADVHQWHGNTPLVGELGKFERITCVFYYREKMHRCLSPEEEVRFAATRNEGDPMWPEAPDEPVNQEPETYY